MNRAPQSDHLEELVAIARENRLDILTVGGRYAKLFGEHNAAAAAYELPTQPENPWEARRNIVAAVAELKHGEVCGRCQGHGGWSGWPGWTCFECGGRGWV